MRDARLYFAALLHGQLGYRLAHVARYRRPLLAGGACP